VTTTSYVQQYNRTEQLDSVQPLKSCATVLAKAPSNKSLHHNHN